MNKKPLIPQAPPSPERPWYDLVQDPHRAMMARMARWDLPLRPVPPVSRDDHRVQIGAGAGEVNVTHSVQHIGSQVNHIHNGKLVASLEEEAHPSSWPELIRASVWGGL